MKTKQIVKELALLVGAALGIFLVLVLIAWVRSLTGGTLGGSLWRLSAFAGAVIWLLAAVFLLSGRLGRKRIDVYKRQIPYNESENPAGGTTVTIG